MTLQDLKTFRDLAGLRQADLAALLGMSPRAYQDLELGASAVTDRLAMALERVSLRLALARGDIGLALPAMRRDALDYAALVRGEESAAARAIP